MLVNLDHESRLHAWLLQGMTKTGRLHWKECADYYKQFRPTFEEVYPQEHSIKYYQYVKAINHIGVVPDMQGRLLDVVGQVRNAESLAGDEGFVTCLRISCKAVTKWSL